MLARTFTFVTTAALALSIAGCEKRPSLFRNSDAALNKTSSQFSSDAANRSYHADAARAGQADGRASVDYQFNTVQVANLSSRDWTDVEVWVNHKYVVFVPRIPARELRTFNFQMLYDGRGNHLPTKSVTPQVQSVELYMNGQMYDVPIRLAE
ncbi:MAG TPA: hypothetical protein VK324_10365 [Tepidisphaeraceae bacterium]|nr:hypothetical protein [Tepidisphaeraceae bacterium]